MVSQLASTFVGGGIAVPLAGPDRDRAAARPRREHVVRRLPAPVEHPRARRLPAAPVPVPGRPARVQHGHRRPGGRGDGAARRRSAAASRALIPLYTVGVFIAFTLSQAGMVRHWWRLRAERAAAGGGSPLVNGIGAVDDRASWRSRSAASKFVLGRVGRADPDPDPDRGDAVHQPPLPGVGGQARGAPGRRRSRRPRRRERVIVPVAGINRAVVQAINVGRSIGRDVHAVLISDAPDEAATDPRALGAAAARRPAGRRGIAVSRARRAAARLPRRARRRPGRRTTRRPSRSS